MPVVRRRFSVVELYAGTARSSEPFKSWNRSKVELLVDRDEFSAHTYRRNFPRSPYLVADISRLTATEIKWFAGGSVDILLGCPPCTGFSDVGSRNFRAFQNSHLTRFSQLAVELRPLAIAVENVPIAAKSGRFSAFVARLAAAGYESTYGILNSALRGSSQCRHRLMYIGIRKDVGATPTIGSATHGGGNYFSYGLGRCVPIGEDPKAILSQPPGAGRHRLKMPYVDKIVGRRWIPTVSDAIGDLPAVGSRLARKLSHYRWRHSGDVVWRMSQVEEGGRWNGGTDHYSHSYGRLHRRGLARTITTFFPNAGSGRFWHPTEERTLTIREAARLQGFPDSFRFFDAGVGSSRLVGNALDATLASVAFETIRQALE